MSRDKPNIPNPRGEKFNPHEHLTEEEKESIWRSRDALKGEREAFLGLDHAPPCAQGAWREIWKSGIAFVARGDTFNVNFGPEVHIQLSLVDDIEAFEQQLPSDEPFSVSRYRDPSENDFAMAVIQV
jgi:endonuclease YncB( thermonuclease family)